MGLELAREFRFWGTASCAGCPWGAIALVIVCAFGCGIFIGFCVALAFVSTHCRQGLVVVLRGLASVIGAGLVPPAPRAGARLAEYRRDQ